MGLARGLSVERSNQVADAYLDLIAQAADCPDRLVGWVGEIPVDVTLARKVWAAVTATHRDHYICPLDEVGRQLLGFVLREVDADLAHDRDHRGVDASRGVGDAPGGVGGVAACGRVVDEGATDLGPAGVVEATKRTWAIRRLRHTEARAAHLEQTEAKAPMAVPATGPTIQIQKWLHVPDASAGPKDRAGFILAPETPPPTSMSNSTTPPIAIAAAAPTARVSVETA